LIPLNIDAVNIQQDSTIAHHACESVKLRCRKKPDFIPMDLWPSNSPNLN